MLIQNVSSYEDFQNYISKYKFIIVNISASWCKPCVAIKPNLEKFISVIEEPDFIYLKIDNSIYDMEPEFERFFSLKHIPYFAFIRNGTIVNAFVSGDFQVVSKRLFDNITREKNTMKGCISSYEFNKDVDF